MPTTSSYYADLEYPTANEDASTYGTLINIYLNDLLGKLATISTRVTNSQAQLGNINRGTNAVDNLNTTLSGAIGSSALLPSTGTTLLPDPYSGTYTKTTSWPAFTSELASYSPPTTQSEVENFNYQGFASALTTELNRIDATVTQAEADLLAAQKDTCRAKKYIDTFQNDGTTSLQAQIQSGSAYPQQSDYGGSWTSIGTTSRTFTFTTAGAAQQILNGGIAATGSNLYVSPTYGGTLASALSGASEGDEILTLVSLSASSFTQAIRNGDPFSYSINTGTNSVTISHTSTLMSNNIVVSSLLQFVIYDVVSVTTYPTPDLTECDNPSPPYFI
jgi:hypothetical protein